MIIHKKSKKIIFLAGRIVYNCCFVPMYYYQNKSFC
jgi:hypothetical protein